MRNLSVDPPVGTRPLLRQAWRRLRQMGPSWTLRRALEEVTVPTTALGAGLKAIAAPAVSTATLPARLLSRLVLPDAGRRSTLYCFYDLRVEPVSFDFLWFLIGADVARRRYGMTHLHVVIVPGPENGFRVEDAALEAVVDVESRSWRLQNMLLDSVVLLPSAAGCTLCHSREQAALLHRCARRVYPAGYSVAFPVPHSPADAVATAQAGERVGVLRATPQALRYADQWLQSRAGGRLPVSITLREYALSTARNSNMEAWRRFADRLAEDGFFPVIVRDTETSLGAADADFGGHAVFREASWNVPLRMAIYERCVLNAGVSTGPMVLCWLNDLTRYLTFKMSVPQDPGTSETAYRVRGITPGQSLEFATPDQAWVWQDDSFETIDRAFQAMRKRIDGPADSRPQ